MEPEEPTYRRGEFAKKGEIILREHEYDGIQEFDQKLPNWWLFTFYGAIVFFFAMWFFYYTINAVPSDGEKISKSMEAVFKKKNDVISTLTDAILVHEWATDESKVKAGETIYFSNCFTCHGPNMDAPTKLALSLVDHDWKYGGKPMEIFHLINGGTPPESKGMEGTGARMLPYGQMYSPEQIAALTAFIISKNPEDFKDF